MNRLLLAFAVCAVLLSRLALAEQVRHVYETSVPVASQGEAARHAALAVALKGVLVKVTGSGDVSHQAALNEAFSAPERYLRQFRYRTENGSRFLWVLFDAPAIDQLLRGKGLPVWSTSRPLILVWIATEEMGKRRLLAAGDNGDVVSAINASAYRRGLPVRFPLVDDQDQARVRLEDVWGDNGATIMAGSSRYRPQAVVSGMVSMGLNGTWRGRWSLRREGAEPMRWESGGTLAAVVDAGIDGAADTLARAYVAAPAAVVADGKGAVAVRIKHLRTLEEYLEATGYLRGLSGVTAVQPWEVNGDVVLYRVSLQGTPQALAQAIALGHTLVPANDPALQAGELTYRLSQ